MIGGASPPMRVKWSQRWSRAARCRASASSAVSNAVTNPLGLGFEQALVGVKTSGAPGEVADEISRWPEADYVVVTAGRFDIVVEVVVAGRQELLELTDRMRALDGVASTETFFYLEMWKQLYDWGAHSPVGEPAP